MSQASASYPSTTLRVVPLPILRWGGNSVLRLDDDQRLVRLGGRRRDAIARPGDEILERRAVESELLHQSVDDRRLGAVAKSGGDGARGKIAFAPRGATAGGPAVAARKPLDLDDLDRIDRL